MRASIAIAILCLAAEVALSVALPLPASKSFEYASHDLVAFAMLILCKFVNPSENPIEPTHPGSPTQPKPVPHPANANDG